MEKNNRVSSYVGFAIISIIIGSILLTVGSYIKNDLTKADENLVDATVKVSSYEDIEDGKVNVICKYGYGGNDKFCATAVSRTNSVDGDQYVSNGTYPIPTSYLSYTTNQYYIYCNIVT